MPQTFRLQLTCRGGAFFRLTRLFASEQKALLAAKSLLETDAIRTVDILVSETRLDDDWHVHRTVGFPDPDPNHDQP